MTHMPVCYDYIAIVDVLQWSCSQFLYHIPCRTHASGRLYVWLVAVLLASVDDFWGVSLFSLDYWECFSIILIKLLEMILLLAVRLVEISFGVCVSKSLKVYFSVSEVFAFPTYFYEMRSQVLCLVNLVTICPDHLTSETCSWDLRVDSGYGGYL